MTSADSTRRSRLESIAYVALLGCAAATQFSIAAAQSLFALTAVLWLVIVLSRRETVALPPIAWPLLAYAGVTLVSAVFSIDPATSLRDSKQLFLFLLVPIVYRLLPGERALKAVDVIITIGAVHAVYGIVQYGILNFDDVSQRPQGLLSHYMTYSGIIMLVACTAVARVMYRSEDRIWAALVLPALLVALALTLSRNAWVGACAGIGLLFLLRDFRLVGLLPVAAALFIALAPTQVSERFYAMFSLDSVTGSDTSTATVQSNRDRIAMIRSGFRIITDHPLTGVGPDMVIQVYPHYRDAQAERQLNPHLHNVPLQIAAERGLPALAVWLWFVFVVIRDCFRRRRTTTYPSLAMTGLACAVAMVAAGMFEYNFHDSEFLMLFLVLVTLPYAADRAPAHASVASPLRAA
jgi:O-antigen ligase